MPHDGSSGIAYTPLESYRAFETKSAPTQHEAFRASFATNAVDKIFEWLAISPNNPTYLTSQTYRLPKEWLEAHTEMLRQNIIDNLGAVSTNNEAVDLYNALKKDLQKEDEVIEPLAKMFVASDFANAGIKDILAEASTDTEEAGRDVINQHAIRAIGAMVVRGAYFSRLSQKYPESFSEQDRDSFLAMFRQNIVAAVFKAARLDETVRKTTSEPSPAQSSDAPVREAA